MQRSYIPPDFFNSTAVTEQREASAILTNSSINSTTNSNQCISLLQAVPLSVPSSKFVPKCVRRQASYTLLRSAHAKLIPYINDCLDLGYRFYVVEQSRGHCWIQQKVISVPLWTFKDTQNMRDWYLAHELSHAFSPSDCMHGPEFMENLKHICPKESLHHELSYKPKNAMLAGIQYKVPADF